MLSSKLQTYEYVFLLICLTLFIFLLPLFSDITTQHIMSRIIFSLVFLSAIFPLKFGKHFRVVLILISGAIVLNLLLIFVDSLLLKFTSYLINGIFLIFITVVLIINIARCNRVDINVIIGSICGYLLIGIIGAVLFDMGKLFKIFYSAPNEILAPNFYESVYFSIITLTTLGYGDIVPQSKFTEVSAMLISISGQLYLTVLIAMLVGKFIVHSNKKKQ